jgi:hypothetical protein
VSQRTYYPKILIGSSKVIDSAESTEFVKSIAVNSADSLIRKSSQVTVLENICLERRLPLLNPHAQHN